MPTFDPEAIFLTPAQVAERYKMSDSTLANHRAAGTGLPWIKINGKVLYPAETLAEWEAAGQRGKSEETLKRAVARVFGKVSEDKCKELWRAFCAEAIEDPARG